MIHRPLLLLLAMTLGCGNDPLPLNPPEPKPRQESDPSSARNAERASPQRSQTAAAVASHPIDAMPEGQLYRRAIAALDANRWEQAEQLREQLAKHPQVSILAEAIAALELAKRGKYETALEKASEISRVPVMQAEAYMIASEVFRAQGRWADAIGTLQNALEIHPGHLRAHRWLGAIYYDTGAMKLAVEHLRTVAELDPTDYRALRLAGLIHYDYQQFEEAIRDYRAALQRPMPPDMESEVRIRLADSLREQRNVAEALMVLDDASPSADMFAAEAACHEANGHEQQALQAANRAIEQDPAHPRAHLIAGRILLIRRDGERAIGHLKIAVDADPTDHEPRFLLGRSLLLAGETEAAQAELERSTELKEWTLELAEMHLQAIERPADVELRVRMGKLAEQLGRPQTAVGWYRAALGLDPNHAAAAEALQTLAPSEPDRP